MKKLLFIIAIISLIFVSCKKEKIKEAKSKQVAKKEMKLDPSDPRLQSEINALVREYTLACIYRDYDKAIEMTIDGMREYSIEVKKKGYDQEKMDLFPNTGVFLKDKYGIRVIYEGSLISEGDVAKGNVVVALKRKGDEFKIYEYFIVGKEVYGKEHKSSKLAEMYNVVLDWAEASQKRDIKKMLSLCKKHSHWELKTEVDEDAVYRIISLKGIKYDGREKVIEGKIEVTRETGSVTRYLFRGYLEIVKGKLLLDKISYIKIVQE